MSSNYQFSVHIASLRSIMLNVNESEINFMKKFGFAGNSN